MMKEHFETVSSLMDQRLAEKRRGFDLTVKAMASNFIRAFDEDATTVYMSGYAFPTELLWAFDVVPFDFEIGCNNMPAVALTDHGNIFGAVSFFRQAKEKKIKPILGCEVYVAPRSRTDKNPHPNSPHHFHLILLVKDEKGYKNLCQLITKSYLEGFYYRPRIDKQLLAEYGEGFIGFSGCLKGEGLLNNLNYCSGSANRHISPTEVALSR